MQTITTNPIVADVLARMNGWNGSKIATLEDVAKVAEQSDGDHLEIGTFFGASAIVFALTRKTLGRPGRVYCIDPFIFENQESDIISRSISTAVNMESVFFENVRLFGVQDRIVHIKKPSQPTPPELNCMRFGSVLIDGLHTGETPLMDAKLAMSVCDGYIILDDVIGKYPAIITAYNYMVAERWVVCNQSIHAVTFRKE